MKTHIRIAAHSHKHPSDRSRGRKQFIRNPDLVAGRVDGLKRRRGVIAKRISIPLSWPFRFDRSKSKVFMDGSPKGLQRAHAIHVATGLFRAKKSLKVGECAQQPKESTENSASAYTRLRETCQ